MKKSFEERFLDVKFKEVDELQDEFHDLFYNSNRFVRFFNRTFRIAEAKRLYELSQEKLNKIISGEVLDEMKELIKG